MEAHIYIYVCMYVCIYTCFGGKKKKEEAKGGKKKKNKILRTGNAACRRIYDKASAMAGTSIAPAQSQSRRPSFEGSLYVFVFALACAIAHPRMYLCICLYVYMYVCACVYIRIHIHIVISFEVMPTKDTRWQRGWLVFLWKYALLLGLVKVILVEDECVWENVAQEACQCGFAAGAAAGYADDEGIGAIDADTRRGGGEQR